MLQGSGFPSLRPATPLARLNQEFLAAQLNLRLAGRSVGLMNGELQCYGRLIDFRPVILGNGAALTHFSTLGDLFEQAVLAIRENRVADMDQLAGLFNLLNGEDPSGNCASWVKQPIRVPQDYPTIQEAVNAAKPGDVIRVGPGEFRGATVNRLCRAGRCLRSFGVLGNPSTMRDYSSRPGRGCQGHGTR